MLVISATANNKTALTKNWYGLLKNAIEKITDSTENGIYSYQTGDLACDNNLINITEDTDKPETGLFPSETVFDNKIATTHREYKNQSSPDAALLSIRKNIFQARRDGVLLHKFIEHMSPPAALTAVDASAREIPMLNEPESQHLLIRAKEIVSKPEFAFLFNPENYTKAFKEAPVSYLDNQGKQQYGIIDRLVVTDNEAWIVDFKSRTDMPATDDLINLAQTYKPQLDYYASGIKKIWPQRKIRKAILFTNTGDLIELF